MNQLRSNLFRLSKSDAVRGLVTAIFTAIVVVMGSIVTQPNFDVFTIDWGSTTHLMLNAGTAAFFAYLGKNFFSDSTGKFVGKV